MTETGPISHECPARPGVLHVIESAYLPEVVDAAGKPVPAGEMGELVVTTLRRTAAPLLRYRTGDLVRVAVAPEATCACGRCDLALAGGILGRADDMVIIRGVNIYPSAVEEILRGFGEIAEYQARVSPTAACRSFRCKLKLAAGSEGGEAAVVRRLQERLHAAFNLRVAVTVAPAGSLPRYEMKASRWQKFCVV